MYCIWTINSNTKHDLGDIVDHKALMNDTTLSHNPYIDTSVHKMLRLLLLMCHVFTSSQSKICFSVRLEFVHCKMQNEKCKMPNAKCKMLKAKFKMQNAK